VKEPVFDPGSEAAASVAATLTVGAVEVAEASR
jgi:hypothetical protein